MPLKRSRPIRTIAHGIDPKVDSSPYYINRIYVDTVYVPQVSFHPLWILRCYTLVRQTFVPNIVTYICSKLKLLA